MADAARKEAVLRSLTAGIAELVSSAAWQSWLDLQSRFHQYSFGNCLLIQRQRPEATRVAGFHAWRRLGRTVRHGEKGIWIVAPIIQGVAIEQEDDQRHPGAQVLSGFRTVPIFDIVQTDGEPLPESPVQRLRGEAPGKAYEQLAAVAYGIGYAVEKDHLFGEINGDCSFGARRIRVEITNDDAQQVKSLAHELAHGMLHEEFADRALAELEAESVAYVVCNAIGLPTDSYSFGYVAGWAGGSREAIAGIKAAASRIQQTADRILGPLESCKAIAARRTVPYSACLAEPATPESAPAGAA